MPDQSSTKFGPAAMLNYFDAVGAAAGSYVVVSMQYGVVSWYSVLCTVYGYLVGANTGNTTYRY
jgi:hypothetical protein